MEEVSARVAACAMQLGEDASRNKGTEDERRKKPREQPVEEAPPAEALEGGIGAREADADGDRDRGEHLANA